MKKIKYLLNRLMYFLKYGKDGYGKRDFTELYYKGSPILQRDNIPTREVWFVKDLPGGRFKVIKKVKLRN